MLQPTNDDVLLASPDLPNRHGHGFPLPHCNNPVPASFLRPFGAIR